MKNELVIITVFLAVMLVMPGIAAAHTIGDFDLKLLTLDGNQVPLEIPMSPGQSINYSLYMANFNNHNDNFLIKSEVLGIGGSDATDVTITKHPASFVPGEDPHIQVDALTIALGEDATPGNKYLIGIGLQDCQCNMQNAITIHVISAVPEFPTIALPVAAVIGLVFFFHKKKPD